MKGFYDRIFDKVEMAACNCATEVTRVNVKPEDIYSGKTKTTLAVSIARSMAFMVMHDSYGIKYSLIAKRAGMSEKAVMKSTAKARAFRFSDYYYKKTYELMMKMI